MRITDLRNNPEAVSERERQKQANDLLQMIVVFDAERKPGAFIKKYGKKFSRLNELKSEHFQNRIWS